MKKKTPLLQKARSLLDPAGLRRSLRKPRLLPPAGLRRSSLEFQISKAKALDLKFLSQNQGQENGGPRGLFIGKQRGVGAG